METGGGKGRATSALKGAPWRHRSTGRPEAFHEDTRVPWGPRGQLASPCPS